MSEIKVKTDLTTPFPPELQRMLETGEVQGRTRTQTLMGASTRNNLAVLAAMLDYVAP